MTSGSPVLNNPVSSAISAYVGGATGDWVWPGAIDHVKIYDYARTPAQIAWDYNRGGPIGHWKFDECQGTTAYDSSGFANNGTINIGSTSPQTSVGTCTDGQSTSAWYNGVTGKLNSSLKFDGADDYIQAGTAPVLGVNQDFTISEWVKKTDTSTKQSIASNDYSTDRGVNFALDSSARMFIRVGSVTANTGSYSANVWEHHVLVADRDGNAVFYRNGLQNGSPVNISSESSTILGDGVSWTFGAQAPWNVQYFDGQIDDVKIFNYALTVEQIKTLHNEGAVRFGD